MPSLAGDLKTIRRDHKLSIQDMYELTRIPLDTIKAIEDGTLFEDESRNSTYIRSFVRTYARALKISEDDIVKALDDQIIGVYNGFLFDRYGSGSSKVDQKSGEKDAESSQKGPYGSRFKLDLPEKEAEPPSPGDEVQEAGEAETPAPVDDEDLYPGEEAGEPEIAGKSEEPVEETLGTPSVYDREEFSTPEPGKSYSRKIAQPPTIKSVDWASIGKKTYSLSRRPGTLLLIMIAIIVVAGGIFMLARRMEKTPKHEESARIGNVDSLATPPLMTRSDSVKAGLLPAGTGMNTLPDTLKLTIYAAFGTLSPVRVQTDLAKRLNPYWIDEGEGMLFNFKDSINVKGIYNNMIFLYNGHPLDDFRKYIRKDDILHLERSYFSKHPQWEIVTHDTLPGGVPQPNIVRNQPLY